MGSVPASKRDELTREMAHWMTNAGISPPGVSATAYLSAGFVPLALAVWPLPQSSRPRLVLTVKWMLWMWLADDHYDTVLLGERAHVAAEFHQQCSDALDQPDTCEQRHPLAKEVVSLARQTSEMMPPWWWKRYQQTMTQWMERAYLNHVHYDRPQTTPTVAEYLAERPIDGGMMLAAQWCDLALNSCITEEEWASPRVQDILTRFSNVSCWMNDLHDDPKLYEAGKGRNLVSSLVLEGFTPDVATAHVAALTESERRLLMFLGTAAARDATARHGLRDWIFNLLLFTEELEKWTNTSSRY